MTQVDDLDRKILLELADDPRLGVLELSRRLGVARGTVQARMTRLAESTVRAGQPDIDPAALGYGVTAYAMMQIRQGRGAAVAEHLEGIAEVLEVHTITGDADILCQLVAKSNDDLQRVINDVISQPDVVRVSSYIALTALIPWRTRPLVQRDSQRRDEVVSQ